MAKQPQHKLPLTRYRYFTKNLYNNTAGKSNFTYEKVIYEKDEVLQKAENKAQRLNLYLVLALVLMFVLTGYFQNVYIVVGCLFTIVAGEITRLLMLPRDITDHLTDTGWRDRS